MEDIRLDQIMADNLEDDQLDQPDAKTSTEDLLLKRLGIEIQILEDVRNKRKSYPMMIFVLLIVWLVIIFVILFMQGCNGCEKSEITAKWSGIEVSYNQPPKFRLDSSVLIALIGGTTASVIALWAIVIRNLFPKHDSNTSDKEPHE